MSIVREEVTVDATRLEGVQSWVPPAAVDAVKDDVLTQVECLVWRRFDALRSKFRIKVLFFTIDAGDVVEYFLTQLFGSRPNNCP